MIAEEDGVDEDQKTQTEDGENKPTDISAPYTLMASVLIGCGLGYAIDEHYDTSPAWMITMFLLFMGVGFYHVIKSS